MESSPLYSLPLKSPIFNRSEYNHIVARKGQRAPQDYADCFTILVELNVITSELATPLKKMARFRNLIVHLYWKVDNHRVYEIIQEDLDDLDIFRQQISTWLTS